MESATLTRHSPGTIRLGRLRAVPAKTWARIGFAALCLGALIGYFAFPTYPTYDSFYALLWGRDLLHGHLPDFSVYRGPTEHPLAIAFGMFSSIFGQGGARLMVLGSIASFVAAVAGMYRLGRLCFGPVVGLVAALLLLSRFFVENLAAQGYLDITYVALIVWAIVLEVERPRRGTPVFLVLAAAGLLRPDAWVLSGAYWLWCSWRADNRTRLKYLALALIAPLVWVALDAIVTGNPLYSLTATAGLAAELERTQGFTSVVGSVWNYGVRIDKLPVLLGGLIGLPLAVWLAPRRVLAPLAALRAARRRVRGRGRRRRVGRRPLPGRRRDRAAAVLRRHDRRLGDAAAGLLAAPLLDRRSDRARALRRLRRGHDAQPVEPAQDARLPRGLPQGPGRRAAEPAGQGPAAALPARCRCPTTS